MGHNLAMDSKTVGTPEVSQVQALSRRVFERTSSEAPPPTYINNVEFIGAGMDIFMDAGIVSPESVKETLETDPGDGLRIVKFNVDFRFGMSLQTAMVMHQRLSDLIQQATAQLAAADAQTRHQEVPK